MSKYPKVSSVSDVPVYHSFCKMTADAYYKIIYVKGLCEDDNGAVAFLDAESKERYLKRRSKRMPAEEYERRKKEGQRRRCKK